MSRRDVAQVVFVTVLWALCYPLISVAVADAPPLSIGALRAVIAGCVLLAIAKWKRRPWPTARTLGAVTLAGLGLTSMGFGGMFLAGGRVSPGLATVISNIQPLLAALVGVFVLDETLVGRRGLALGLGFLGIVVTSLPTLLGGPQASSYTGIAFVLVGATGVAIGNVLLKRVASQVDALVAAGWSLLVGAVPLWIVAVALGEAAPHHLSTELVWSVTALALLGTALVSLLWFDLLQRNALIHLNTFTFLTPVFGLLIAGVFLGERLTLVEWIGVAIVLLATVWTSLPASSKRPDDGLKSDR